MRITALEPQRRDDERVNVHVDGAFRCGLALEIVLAAGLRVGADIDEATLAELERQDLRWKCRQSALALLAYRARSAAELRRRLLWKGFPPDVADEVLADLREKRYVDDAAFAAAFVRDRVHRRPRGRRRLVQELRARGVEAATAGDAVDDAFADHAVSEVELARAAAEAWIRKRGALATDGDARRDARRRLRAYLARRGFAGDAIRDATRALD
ncbi:MAG: RecX family transcriptional regulator [Gemmatimonadetes bacterium]|nr:RecX family transcriptional regulator [Gemmatimonadota bacterium]